MFQPASRQSGLAATFGTLELIYHGIARGVRKNHRNALMSILLNMLQAVLFVSVFYVMFVVLGLRGASLRGDFLLYVMSGIFLYLTHISAFSAVLGSDGPTSAMMKHAPMNTIISISSAALGSLYTQLLTMLVILFIYHAAFTPIEIAQPIAALGAFIAAWFTGVAAGLVFLALKPWFPRFIDIAGNLYRRVNMIASGKMFVANALPAFMLRLFDWNPLFHCVDQARGFVFINYFPRNSSMEYALIVGVCLLMLGLIGEFYTRKRASLSWGAKL